MDIWRGTRPGRYKGRNYESVKSSTQATLWIRYIKLYKVQEHKIKVEEKC